MHWYEIVALILGLGASTLIAWLSLQSGKLIKAKVGNELVAGILARLTEAVFTAVDEVQQAFVDATKAGAADGKLTPDEQAKARQAALSAVKRYLGTHGLQALVTVLGLSSKSEADAVILGRVESALSARKREAKAVAAPLVVRSPPVPVNVPERS